MMINNPCFTQTVGRRRVFWTTQPEVCGDYILCGFDCSIPGLEYQNILKQNLPLTLADRMQAVDTIDATTSILEDFGDVLAAADVFDASTVAPPAVPMSILSAERAGLRSAAVKSDSNANVISDIGIVQ